MRLRSGSGLTRSVARRTLARSQTRTQRALQFVPFPLCKYQQFILLSLALLPGQRVPPLQNRHERARVLKRRAAVAHFINVPSTHFVKNASFQIKLQDVIFSE